MLIFTLVVDGKPTASFCAQRVQDARELAAARKLVEIAASTPAVQDGRIYIEHVNATFMIDLQGQRPRVRRRHPHRDRARLALDA